MEYSDSAEESCSAMEADEEVDDENEWRADSSFITGVCPQFAGRCSPASRGKMTLGKSLQNRVILHFDLDCFYAQVEMIHNPSLRNKPVGVHQKYLMVTCNYVARELGVNKIMTIGEAKEKCPQLVLVKGEDLTPYREMSYKVTEFLEQYCPLVERLGLDENFLDVTEMVEKRLTVLGDAHLNVPVVGHIYNDMSLNPHVDEHIRLAVGSQIAAELRSAVYNKLGLTGCAGIATNKILAKLVSGTFKPNQQTTLLPESTLDLMKSLPHLKKVPGVGYRTAEKFQSLGLSCVQDLQAYPLAALEKEIGATLAQRMHSLSHGIDDSPVSPRGPPQSLSDEDSFRKVSSEAEVMKKIDDLLESLLFRMQKDGRQPRTIRLTTRRFTTGNKWHNREARQCPIPNHIGQKIVAGCPEVKAHLVDLCMKLFAKMFDLKMPFHITLLNVCLSNLQPVSTSSKGSIGFFLTNGTKSPLKSTVSTEVLLQPSEVGKSQKPTLNNYYSTGQEESEKNPRFRSVTCFWQEGNTQGTADPKNSILNTCKHPEMVSEEDTVMVNEDSRLTSNILSMEDQTESIRGTPFSDGRLPPEVDLEVFSQLPEDIQREIAGSSLTSTPDSTSSFPCFSTFKKQSVQPGAKGKMSFFQKHQPQMKHLIDSIPEGKISDCIYGENRKNSETFSMKQPEINMQVVSKTPASITPDLSQDESRQKRLNDHSMVTDVPPSVDPKVFSELPIEFQRELLTEWKQQKHTSKISVNKHMSKNTTKDGKPASSKRSQTNSLLKYFKQT
ncbi:POLI polymerase, partial [Polypterus senegalus]